MDGAQVIGGGVSLRIASGQSVVRQAHQGVARDESWEPRTAGDR